MVKRVPIDTYCEKAIASLPKTYDGWIDYIDISSVDNAGKKITSFQTIDSRDAPSRAKQLLKKGDVIVSTVRPNLNAVAIVEDETENLMVGSTGYCVLRCKEGLDARYLFNFCQSQYFIDNMSSQATGASYPAVSAGIVRSSLIPWRSIDEQRGIAEKLNLLGRLASLRKQQLAKLDELVKARFVEMFGDIKETVPLSHYISALSAGKSLAGEEECANKVLKTGAATYDEFDPSQVKNLPIDYTPQADHLLRTGDVIISRMNTAELVGAAAYVWEAPINTYLPDRLWRAELKSNACPIFVWQSLIQATTKESIRKIASGTSGSMKNISKPRLLGIHIKKVEFDIQQEFSDFVAQVHKQKLTIQQSLDKMEVLKKTLMQEYFG